MDYKEAFSEIRECVNEAAQKNAQSCRHYIFRNTQPADVRQFPTPVTKKILNEYKSYLENEAEKEDITFEDFLLNPAADGPKVLPVDKIPLWETISHGIDNPQITNTEAFPLDVYNGFGNATAMVIPMRDEKKIYVLSVHRNMVSALADKIIYYKWGGFWGTKKVQREVNPPDPGVVTGEFLVLSSQIDAIIYDGHCFIFNVGNFSRFFKYEEIVNQELNKQETTIRKELTFISDGDKLWNMIHGKISMKREILKAAESGRLEKFKGVSAADIKGKITDHQELAHITFDSNDRVEITEKSYRDVVGILSDRIHIDLVFDGVNGVEQHEQ